MKKVRIKTWEEMEKEFGINKSGYINANPFFTPYMEKLLPSNRIIKLEDNGRWKPRKSISYSIVEYMIKQDAKEDIEQYPAPLPYTAPDGRKYNVYTHMHPQLNNMIGTYGYFYDYSPTDRIGEKKYKYKLEKTSRMKNGHPSCENGKIWSFFAVPVEQEKTAKIVITENGETREVELTNEQIEQLGL